MNMRAGFTAIAGAATMIALTALAGAQTIPMPAPAPRRDLAQNTKPAPQIFPPPLSALNPFSRPGAALDDKQRALADRVSLYLTSIQTLVGDFVQVGPDGSRTEGQLYIQKPGKVRFEYKPPSVIDVIADGNSVVVRDRKLATQDLYPLSQTPLRFLLADRIDLQRDTTVTSVSADDVFVTVTIEERQQFIGTSKLMMMFGAKDLQLRQWTVTDPQGYDTTVAVYNLDTTKKPDPSLFVINYSNDAMRVQ